MHFARASPSSAFQNPYLWPRNHHGLNQRRIQHRKESEVIAGAHCKRFQLDGSAHSQNVGCAEVEGSGWMNCYALGSYHGSNRHPLPVMLVEVLGSGLGIGRGIGLGIGHGSLDETETGRASRDGTPFRTLQERLLRILITVSQVRPCCETDSTYR